MDAIVKISSHHHNNYRILLYSGVAINEEGNKDVTPLMTHVMFALLYVYLFIRITSGFMIPNFMKRKRQKTMWRATCTRR